MARQRGRGLPILWIWCWTLINAAMFALAADPEVKVNRFHDLPAKFFYFEDTSTMIYHDYGRGTVHISADEGKNWKRIDKIPQGKAEYLVAHPFDSHTAFVLSAGTKHWRTEDRGETWQEFETPVEPAMVANPLSFHYKKDKQGYVIFQGRKCQRTGGWHMSCRDDAFYTTDAFSSSPKSMFTDITSCMFAHSRKEFEHKAHDHLVYCVGFDKNTVEGGHSLAASRIFSSTDFFTNFKVEDLGFGNKGARGVVALAIVSKYAVAALKDLTAGGNGDMLLYVSTDAEKWTRASFPHGNTARLRENAYTVVESTTHSLGVDVILDDHKSIGTLFVSSSDGTQFSPSLSNTNRNSAGYVDFENLYGVDGVGMANIVDNAQEVENRGAPKKLQSKITFDDGHTWQSLKAPAKDVDGKDVGCDVNDGNKCALHLHSVSVPHNYGRIFSSPAPGFVMGVGSIGEYLKSYTECDTFLSTDAGITWQMVRKNAHIYEFGDQGGIIVMMNDEEPTDTLLYSLDLGKTWKEKKLGVSIRSRALTTISDSTSQKFLILGLLSRSDSTADGGTGALFVDFAGVFPRKCDSGDKMKWYGRNLKGKECVMGHKQWYWRRKPEAICYMGEKFEDPEEHEEDCTCEDEDFECDFNYVAQEGECVPLGPEPIGAGVCQKGTDDEEYEGSSGYRKIPGNTCSGGSKKDTKVKKKCSNAAPAPGQVIHQTFKFPAAIVQHQYFNNSPVLLVRLADNTIWHSPNEGYTWTQIPGDNDGKSFFRFYMHKFDSDRAYLITPEKRYFFTTNRGKHWDSHTPPTRPNAFGIPHLQFHPTKHEYMIWIGMSDGCKTRASDCHAVAHYTSNNGRTWDHVADYVRNCEWARDKDLKVDPHQIMCEHYTVKGDQSRFTRETPMELISGKDFYKHQTKLFDQVVGFTKFSEYLVVAEMKPATSGLTLQVSLDGTTFASGMFPPGLKPEAHSFTILESTTDSLFVYMNINEAPNLAWGNIMKSNSNGTYFTTSVEYVNRNFDGYVDFEKMIGIDGVGLINVVGNPQEAVLSGNKKIQTKITHNDGGSWKFMTPPKTDSNGREYDCQKSSCHLHIHGYTERYDPSATYSTPSVPGMLMAVGNVGSELAKYTDSDTFISRDAGFHWEEVHKDAHLWEFGDSGSVLVAANDEVETNEVIYTTDEGLHWKTYKFSDEKMRVRKIITVPQDTSRKFILLCESPNGPGLSITVQLDFSAVVTRQCKLQVDNSDQDDFELWSPAEEREEACLFGRKTLYHRRLREAQCTVGEQTKLQTRIQENCSCKDDDFECEYNHVRNAEGKCELIPGEKILPDDKSCNDDEGFWYERTAYRKIAHSTCEGGPRPDRGPRHQCPGFAGHSAGFWWTVFALPFVITGAVAWWWHRTRGFSGAIRLPGAGDRAPNGGAGYRGQHSGVMDTLASVPWYIVGVAGVAWEWATSHLASFGSGSGGGRRGYRNVPVDEDAQVLRFEDEE